MEPRNIPYAEHAIPSAAIGSSARRVLETLHEHGFDGLLVGGCVRDLMLGREPKDFDVVTNATPEQVRGLFRRARLVGRRFLIAHVRFGREVIEVTTYRASPGAATSVHSELTDSGRLLRDNVFGSREEDALRRDLTINALYLDVRANEVIDYAGGVEDLNAGLVRVIGDPETRYREDPVRMLRAVRFAARLGFRIETQSAAPIRALADQINEVPAARLFDEVIKLFHGGQALQTFELLRHYGLFSPLFPAAAEMLAEQDDDNLRMLLPGALASTDARVQAGKPVTPAFLFAAALWEPVRRAAKRREEHGMAPIQALQDAGQQIITEQQQFIAVPRRFSIPVREIWDLQPRLEQRHPRRVLPLLEHRRFRAAYDFLVLRSEIGEVDPSLARWWTEIQEDNQEQRVARATELPAGGGGGGGRRRGRRRRRRD
ncbi:MAG: polynucleotide adenylyltransferase PcnB [Gammaproteobacteria bacterium]|nr:polynucleotide adenylyltransferase PcnB [Gammaproteobacteria bacterium]